MSDLYPGSYQIAPMKYCGAPSQDKIDEVMCSEDWILQEKYDGAWYQLEKTDDGEVYLFGRTLSKVTGEYTEKIANVPWLKEWMLNPAIPNGTILIGEIYIPGGHSNDVTKIMGCLPEKAIERQKNIHVQYMVFDCIRYDKQDLCNEPFCHRFGYYIDYLLGEMFSSYSFNGYTEDPHVKMANTWQFELPKEKLKETYADILRDIFADGGEGGVFKYSGSVYRPGKRTTASQMFKIKEHIDSIDLVVMDLLNPEIEYTGKEIKTWKYWEQYQSVYDSNDNICEVWIPVELDKVDVKMFLEVINKHGKETYRPVTKHWYYGWRNALLVGAYNEKGELVEVGRVASGLDDELRATIAANPSNYIGSVVQLSCMSLNKDDLTIRHPVFEQFRFDKNPEDCLIGEIFV